MRNEIKRQTMIGLACMAISLTLSRYDFMPEFLAGALTGCSVLMILIGFLPEKAHAALRSRKKGLLRGER